MRRHDEQVLTVAQMRAAEEALVAAGTSIDQLMQRAGQGAAEWVWRIAAGRPVTVLCGPGNNGGDGYVIAEVLRARGLAVTVIAPMAPRTAAAREARAHYRGEVAAGGDGTAGGVLVDCLFGSGLSRPLPDALARLLAGLAASHAFRIAIDLPSGVNADDATALNEGLPEYDLTLALGAWKLAHWLLPAREAMGQVRLVPIGIGQVTGAARRAVPPALTPPPTTAHKYSRGLLAVIAGEMPGAALLAARAAQHGGAGYVKLFVDEGDEAIDAPPDLVVAHGSLFELVRDRRINAFLIGPGLGRSEQARARLDWVLACDLPTVCDADALHLLDPAMLDGREWPIIATPHAGELDALANSFGSVGLDRIEQVTELAEDLEGVLVAKGPDTLIASAGAPLSIMPPAPSWLSTAGTGDVLAGLVASRLASGASPRKAAEQGCWLHCEAARRAGAVFTAGQLIAHLPAAYAAFL